MKNLTRTGCVVFSACICAVAVVAFASSTALAAKPGGGGGGPTLCPDIWAPVICSNGKTYPNQCYADKARATGCVPTGDI